MCFIVNRLSPRLKGTGRWFTKIFFQPAFYAILVLAALAWWIYVRPTMTMPHVYAMAIGGFVGAVELLGRYRHSPLRAVLTGPGVFYVLINMGASLLAFDLLDAFKVFDDATLAKEMKQILTAGFGSLVFMRSSLFKIRVNESDIGIGPAAILDTLLLVADRGVDRREAVARAQDVSALVANVRDPRIVAKMLTKYSLALMQNVDEQTSQDLGAAVGKIMDDTDIPDAIKMDIIALRLGVVVGPDVIEAAVAALGDRLNAVGQLPSPPPPSPISTSPAPSAPKAEPGRAAGDANLTPTVQSLAEEIAKSAPPKSGS